jgi:hypothetical protein
MPADRQTFLCGKRCGFVLSLLHAHANPGDRGQGFISCVDSSLTHLLDSSLTHLLDPHLHSLYTNVECSHVSTQAPPGARRGDNHACMRTFRQPCLNWRTRQPQHPTKSSNARSSTPRSHQAGPRPTPAAGLAHSLAPPTCRYKGPQALEKIVRTCKAAHRGKAESVARSPETAQHPSHPYVRRAPLHLTA